MPSTAILSERFEFAAAHRLHCQQLTDEQNRSIFGKCNSPNGHGHNYRVEVSVRVPIEQTVPSFTLRHLEEIVATTVIDRFDHKHLNVDTQEFATVNPSVENIAAACHALLVAPIQERGGELVRVTVWETEKTSATYPADQ
jgi:6-pyruvoyltetrahydropterin/6-carboxytetrahydropterin synthase